MKDKIYYAPILIPTLCRYEHFVRCIESLKKNDWAKFTDINKATQYQLILLNKVDLILAVSRKYAIWLKDRYPQYYNNTIIRLIFCTMMLLNQIICFQAKK